MPEGKVVIGFSISNKGKTENVQVISSLNLVLDSVAINSVKNMPSWEPARLNGKPIVSRHSIPLVFNIDSVDIY
jgi:TonB family protein